MGRVIVCNIISADGFYEGKGGAMEALFTNLHPRYRGVNTFDHHVASLLRAGPVLVFGSGEYFLSNQEYWSAIPTDPGATPIRRELSALFASVDKIAVSDTLTAADLSQWPNTTIVKRADAAAEFRARRLQPRDIVITSGRTLWNHLLREGLVDELHFVVAPVLVATGTPILAGDVDVSLELLETKSWPESGNVLLRYAVTPAPAR